MTYPAGAPQAVIDRVSQECDKILHTPAVIERFKALGYVPVGGKPEALKNRIDSDYRRFG